MPEWLFLVILAGPCFVCAAIYNYNRGLADSHRRPEAPPLSRLLEPGPFDLLKPDYYDEVGNRYRRRALLFFLPIPLAWVLCVFATALMLNLHAM